MQFKKLNLIFGWLSFAIAAIVYIITIEPTASFWDCGEFISCAYKLEVGHQPGAPLFMIMGRLFTLLAGNNPANAAMMVNTMSALASAFTILFLFWTITHFARKFFASDEKESTINNLAIIACGLIGSMAYTFSDTFWFSAVEGEVYATSSFFTALVFWLILKWENAADDPYADRWILLIAFIMGLSIGVHLLNLLTIPALVMVYYFKKFKTTTKGVFYALTISAFILGFILYGFIPYIVKLAAWSDLLFVNSFGMSFNIGVYVYLVALIALIIFALYYSYKKRKVLMNKIVLAFTVMLIGYSSYVIIPVRSTANTPINIGEPKDPFSLLNYLNREQYGDRPLIWGANYSAPIIGSEKRYTYIPYKDKYIKSELNPEYKYDSKFMSLFPRMSSREDQHIKAYESWADVKGTPVRVTNRNGETETITKPTFAENLKFFFSYQLGYMYFRYFMWNFAGRQDEIQGSGGMLHGNWISGIPFIDEIRLGNQDKLAQSLTSNKGRNVYYLLPLILGLLGLVYHFKKHKKDFTVVSLFFFFTGIAIVIFLNEVPLTPRERDYAVGGSFYVFCIWLGFGMLYLFDLLRKKTPAFISLAIVFILSLILVPGIMAKENWDDHNRSNRYTARDIAYNYLNSCAPNAILFTNADNDTYPLWYAQEVEGIRRDVRIVLLPFLSADWYINQLNSKHYEADAVPMSISIDKYINGNISYIPIYEKIDNRVDLKQIIEFVASEDPSAKVTLQDNSIINFIPSKKFSLHVDSATAVKNDIISKRFENQTLPSIDWDLNKTYLLKNDLVVLDIIATNNWKRPIYFISPSGPQDIGLTNYLRFDGFVYKLVPVKQPAKDYYSVGSVDSDVLYNLLMKTYKWGNMNNPKVFMDNNNVRTTSVLGIRNCFIRLAEQLVFEKDNKKAIEVLDRCMELTPNYNIPYDFMVARIIATYINADANLKAKKYLDEYKNIMIDDLRYYNSLSGSTAIQVSREKGNTELILQELERIEQTLKKKKK